MNDKVKIRASKTIIEDAKKKKKNIDENYIYWKKNTNLSDSEYESFELTKMKKREYQYTPTLPINSEALDVKIHLEIQYNVDYSISIYGATNLFDEAALVITIYNIDDRPSVTNKAIVRNGRIDFGNILKNGGDYPTGTYVAKVTLSSPDLQDKEFIMNAGQEYENLTGELVSRKGAGPTLIYTQEFTI